MIPTLSLNSTVSKHWQKKLTSDDVPHEIKTNADKKIGQKDFTALRQLGLFGFAKKAPASVAAPAGIVYLHCICSYSETS